MISLFLKRPFYQVKFIKHLFIAICNIIFLSRCTHQNTIESTSSSFFKQDTSKQNKGLIVFVHGVFGDPKGTWTNEQTDAYFPALVSEDPAFSGYDIFTYGFASPKMNTALNIDELGEDLRSTFIDQGFSKYSKIVFVCHSMGGLVSRSFLIKYRDIWASRIKLIYYYATPGSGSQIASLVRFFSKNQQLENLQIEDGDRYLADQSRAWLAAKNLRDIPSYCAYEKQEIATTQVVGFSSASSICNRELDPINENHINIVKPRDSKSKSFVALRNAFKSTVYEYISNEDALSPKVQDDAKKVNYQLFDVNDRPLNVGDFYSYAALVNGNMPSPEDNIFLIGKINKNDGRIFTYDTNESYTGMTISTHVFIGQQTKTATLRKVEPQWIALHFPKKYEILMDKAINGGLVEDDSKKVDYQLFDVNDRPLNVGDFYSYAAIVNGNMPSEEDNMFLIGKINKNDDCIFTYDTDENNMAMAISTNVLIKQQTKTVTRRKIEPQWIRLHFPKKYEILKRKETIGGLVRDKSVT